MHYDVIVVGAGPAGLFASIAAARSSVRVLLLEAMKSGGRKLLISGSGQCNLTHSGTVSELLDHYALAGSRRQKECSRFLKTALYSFSNSDLEQFFTERGLSLEYCENGKLFPVSRRARDVLDVLLNEILVLGVTQRCSCRVHTVKKDTVFYVSTDDGQTQFSSKALVLASGGSSYPATGSRGDGFRIACSFSHHLTEPVPALAPVYVEESVYRYFKECSGIALRNTRIGIYRDNKKTAAASGDLLFTHTGLSGPLILDSSRVIRKGDQIIPAFVPDFTSGEEAEAFLLACTREQGKRRLVRLLQERGLAERLCKALFTALNLPPELSASHLDRSSRKKLACSLAGVPGSVVFPVSVPGGWKEAMVTGGGVSLDEIQPKSMESRLVPSLFFAGEVLDIDGDTGGYNIQAACSTGYLAGISAAAAAKAASTQGAGTGL